MVYLTESINTPLRYATAHQSRFVSELSTFVRFPSVSAQPRHASDLQACAAWLAGHLEGIGLEEIRILSSSGHPVVLAEWMHAEAAPTVLIYGHYDVQPAEPLNAWRHPPFKPVLREGYLYGRGASDNKGQLFIHLKSLESHLRTLKRLPVNVKCVFEGEEEIGSPSLIRFLLNNRQLLEHDVAVISDMPMLAPGRPAISIGLRGSVSLELEIVGPSRDLHSGIFGGAVHNPLQALCEILCSLQDSQGRVAVARFHDRVREEPHSARAALARNGPSDERLLHDAGAPAPWGEPAYSLYERTTIRPALSVNGMQGGYQGPGAKAVIPSRSAAKVNVRLVPDQKSSEILQLLCEHIAMATPASVRSSVRPQFLADPVIVDPGHPAIRAAAAACRRGFGRAPVYLRSGGTIPIASTLQQAFRTPLVLMGFALPDDGMHGPNERFSLQNLEKGIATSIVFLGTLPRALKGDQARKASFFEMKATGR
jgi:acetylornithine deacetylase/succinyl-diaminopimelate desuccinylase-like protein